MSNEEKNIEINYYSDGINKGSIEAQEPLIGELFIWIIGFVLSIIPFIISTLKNSLEAFYDIFATKDLFLTYIGLAVSPFCAILLKGRRYARIVFAVIIAMSAFISLVMYFCAMPVFEDGCGYTVFSIFVIIMNLLCCIALFISSLIVFIITKEKRKIGG